MRKRLEYDKYLNLRNLYQEKVSRIASFRMILFLVMIISFILKYYYYPVFFGIVFGVSLFGFVVLVFVHDKYYKIYDYYIKYVEVMDTYLARECDEWKKFSDKGEDFLDDRKPFLQDLDVLGDCSLYQYLSICKTLGGRERLVWKLSNLEMEEADLREEQEAIAELTQKISFDIEFQIAMQYYNQKKVHLTNDMAYLDKGIGSRKRDFIIAVVASFSCLLLLGLACLHILSFSYFYGMFIFNFLLSFLYSYIFHEEYVCLERTVQSYSKLSGVMDVILKNKFQSSKMKKIIKVMQKGKVDIVRLEKLDSMNSLKNNLLANFLFNGLCCFNLILLYCFSNFLNKNLDDFKESVALIEELEAMISLTSLGIVKKNKCMPVIEKQVGLQFLEIQHPLLGENVCVGNDFEGKAGVHIITGSNMGGKTSFLRTIGINLILMNAGSYVCAKNFQASYFKLFTSMRVVDDIEKGISTFYGELLRIEEMVKYVDCGNMLVLIDEIFKGTNYQDRIYGAREVIHKLSTKKTMVFITTHDFELCEEKGVTNYYVKEEYKGDKIIFDYKIRKGKCSSTNARYLMKKLGIID